MARARICMPPCNRDTFCTTNAPCPPNGKRFSMRGLSVVGTVVFCCIQLLRLQARDGSSGVPLELEARKKPVGKQ
eukprot:6469400-Amphidinium_carterae.2